MRKLLLALTIIGYSYAYKVEYYKNKIFYINAQNAKPLKNEYSLIFKTNIPADKGIILNNGKIIIQNKKAITLLAPDLTVTKEINAGFNSSLLIEGPGGKYVIIGKPDRNKKLYHIYKLEFSTGIITPVITLDKLHFPGIAPIKRVEDIIKNEPGFADDYFSHVYAYEDFAGGFIRHNTLYLWYCPNYGLHKGRIYTINLSKKEIETVSEDVNKLLGYTAKTLVYNKTSDEDATTIEKAIYVLSSGKIKRYPFYFAGTNNIMYGGGRVFAIHNDSLFIVDLSKNKFSSVAIPGKEAKLKSVSHSGMRAFITYKKNELVHLMLYDLHTGTFKTIYGNFKHDIAFLYPTYDGETFVFGLDNFLYVGYTDDYQSPFLWVKAPDTSEIKTIKLSIRATDMAFVSGIKEVKLNGNIIKNDTTVETTLNDSLNVFIIEATDGANNKRILRKIVFYKKE